MDERPSRKLVARNAAVARHGTRATFSEPEAKPKARAVETATAHVGNETGKGGAKQGAGYRIGRPTPQEEQGRSGGKAKEAAPRYAEVELVGLGRPRARRKAMCNAQLRVSNPEAVGGVAHLREERREFGRQARATHSSGSRPEKQWILHLFEGQHERGHGVSEFARQFGEHTVGMDRANDATLDPLVDETYRVMCTQANAGHITAMAAGLPCSIYSRGRTGDGTSATDAPPLNSFEQPDGLPMGDIHPNWRAQARAGAKLRHRTIVLLFLVWRRGGDILIENPAAASYGEFIREDSRGHGPVWLTSEMLWLIQVAGLELVDLEQCYLGSDFNKPTTLAFSQGLESLRWLEEARCACVPGPDGKKHRRVAHGPMLGGQSRSAPSGKYPDRLARPMGAALARSAQRTRAAEVGAAIHAATSGDDAITFRSVTELLPDSWPEKADVSGERAGVERAAALRHLSRRRREPEREQALARKPLPKPMAAPQTEFVELEQRGWPEGAPPRPIHISQLWLSDVYARDIYPAIEGHTAAAAKLVANGSLRPCDVPSERVWRQDEQPRWAASRQWDSRNPNDCVLLQPSTRADPAEKGVTPAFFEHWGKELEWPDKQMLGQACVGVRGDSVCETSSRLSFHHKGAVRNPGPLQKIVDADRRAGWTTAGSIHPQTVPFIATPKNVVEQRKWKASEDGEVLLSKSKWRVASDDSWQCQGETSRNDGMPRDTWAEFELPTPRTLPEAVARVKAIAAEMGVPFRNQLQLEQVAMWALDLSNAYRELGVCRSEWWQQGFIWIDGLRVDLRCLFGSAHLVGLFERITTFVMAVVARRIDQYDTRRPYSEAREAWLECKRQHVARDERASAQFIYLDDGFGLTVAAEGEPPGEQKPTLPASYDQLLSWWVQYGHALARIDDHIRIAAATFSDAGWSIAIEKVQKGLRIELIGFEINSQTNEQRISDVRARMLLAAIAEQARDDPEESHAVPRKQVVRLTGQLTHVAAVETAGRPHLAPMHTVAKGRMRNKALPQQLHVSGPSTGPQAYQAALRWWAAAIGGGLSAPLESREAFPQAGDVGCVVAFTDAAREQGTGFGGWSAIEFVGGSLDGRKMLVTLKQMWPEPIREALEANQLSMPVGEALGAAFLLASLRAMLGQQLTHVVLFTDSIATKAGINSAASGSPQMNFVLQWIWAKVGSVQCLAVHQPGVRNTLADALSRRAEQLVEQRLRAETTKAGLEIAELQPPEGWEGVAYAAMDMAHRHG